MAANRVNSRDYKGNVQFGGGVANDTWTYCWGCKAHRPVGGGKWKGKLKLFRCSKCCQPEGEVK